MTNSTRSIRGRMGRHVLLAALAVPVAFGCVETTKGGGPKSAVSYTSTGTESTLAASIDDVAATTKDVLARNGIVIDESSSDKEGAKREYKGKAHELDVTVTLEKKSDEVTKVEVTARRNIVEVNKDYAKKINDEIAKSV